MNAITLLSGWGNSGLTGPPDGREGSKSRSRRDSLTTGDDGESSHNKVEEGANDQDIHTLSASQHDDAHDDDDDSSAATARGNATNPEDILKPPEAKAYEAIEEASILASHTVDGLDSELTAAHAAEAAYPSPPPTPPIPAIQAEGQAMVDTDHAMDMEQASASEDTAITEKPSRIGVDQTDPIKQHIRKGETDQMESASRNRYAQALAQSFPVRSLTKLYMLLRRFLALFGIHVDGTTGEASQPVGLSPSPSLVTISPIPSRDTGIDPPPPYTDAIEVSPTLSPRLSSSSSSTTSSSLFPSSSATTTNGTANGRLPRWRFPSLRNRRQSSTASLMAAIQQSSSASTSTSTGEEEPGTSSDSSSVNPEASFSSSPNPPDANATSVTTERSHRRRAHHRTPKVSITSAPSIAQLALAKPKLLVLDLDETLIHSTSRFVGGSGTGAFNPVSSAGDGGRWNASTSGLKVRVVEVVLDGRIVLYHVYKRPWVDFFLKKVSTWYTVVIFTASMQEYADPVIDWLDQGRNMIHTRLFREHCTYINGSYVKDLTVVDQDLARVCLVDNSPISYAKDQANGIPIEGWINDPNDEALLDLLPMLDSLRFTNDVRHILGLRLALTSTALPSSASSSSGSGTVKVRRQRTSTTGSTASASAVTDARSRDSRIQA